MSETFWIRFAVFIFIVLSAYAIFIGPPAAYPVGQVVVIPDGASISQAAAILKEKNAIQDPFIFKALLRIGANSIIAGPYLLSGKQDIMTLAYRLSRGERDLAQVKVTIPEGDSVREAADILQKDLGEFDSKKFIAIAKPDEGYLFPDTYFFLPGVTPEDVAQTMKDTFSQRIAPIEKDITAFGKPESEVITMASILEKEARQPETRRIVAGILWKRISLGMPLQVDATFGYIFDKDTYSPSGSDLDIDSPYNTYKYRGLPPGPIGNPGIEAIEDAVTPIATPYLYYVTDKEGNIYYAKTFAEHLKNKEKAQ